MGARRDAPAKARSAARALQVAPATRAKLEMIVSELVANSILHAGLAEDDPVSVHITTTADRVRLAVRDPGPGFARPDGYPSDALAPGGRGFVIVDALADAWGVDCDASGCTVWCEVRVDERPVDAADRHVTDAYLGSLAADMAVRASRG